MTKRIEIDDENLDEKEELFDMNDHIRSDHLKKKEHPKKKKISKSKKEEKDLKREVKGLKKERDEYKEKYVRSLADMDNQRKRLVKEKDEFRKYFLWDFLLEMLEVYDNLERALKIKPVSEEGRNLLSGVKMTYDQLCIILKRYNVQKIEALNKPFDPNFHQALSKVEQEGVTEEIVIEVFQKGFTYNDRLLRPTLAKVAVSKGE
jgi:molecular chaperone GrpE